MMGTGTKNPQVNVKNKRRIHNIFHHLNFIYAKISFYAIAFEGAKL